MSIDVPRESEEMRSSEPPQTVEVGDPSGPPPDVQGGAEAADLSPTELPRLPIPFPPILLQRSGVYRLERPVVLPPVPVPVPIPHLPPLPPIAPAGEAAVESGADGADTQAGYDGAEALGIPLPPVFPLFGTEELRVDVDGVKPTMTVSGTITRLFRGGRLTWIARVSRDPVTGAWTGPITYRDGNAALRPHATVSVRLTGGPILPLNRKAVATFSGGAGSPVTLTYGFQSTAFREVSFEYDTVSDATAVTSHNPAAHPNHSPAAPTSTLSLESAYGRLGIRVTKSGGDDPAIPVPPGTAWSDQEMHDAMQVHWSRWADVPQWAIWVLFARLHDQGTSLGGIMFDDIGTAQRQGTAIFSDSFIAQPPAGEANPGPWVERMKFWTAMHEIGHTFNLAHSWQKSLGNAWVPLVDEPAALSFMNYPYNYPAGLDAFFAAFDYSFSPDELLFLRHAPERFVKMGASPWFSDHGFEQETFEQLRAAPTGPLELQLRVHREPRFEFLEPVVAELCLKNTSSVPTVVDANMLQGDGLAIVVARDGGETRRWQPFARYCTAPAPQVLQPGQGIYASVFLSAGSGGWLVSEPGRYTAYAAAEMPAGGAVFSRPLSFAVDRPPSAEAERLAPDAFSQEVAHTLAFGGSRVLTGANDTLRQVTEELPDSMAAMHANAVLGTPLATEGKVLVVDADGNESFDLRPAEPEQARELLTASLGDFDRAADSLGHIAVTEQTMRLAAVLEEVGDTEARTSLLDESADALARRGVLPGVVEALRRM